MIKSNDPIAECVEIYLLPRGSFQIIIKCPFCRTRHLHGVSRDCLVEMLETEKTIHRLKHCVKEDDNKAYNIHISKDMIEEVLKYGSSKRKETK